MKKISLILFLCSTLSQEYSWPTGKGKHLSSNFGEFRTTGYHLGIDVKTKGAEGLPIYAISDGHIERVVTNYSGFGRALYLKLDDGKTAVYAHLSKFEPDLEERLKEEQKKVDSYVTNFYLNPKEFRFSKNDIIAYSGNTGFSYGPHLHFELRDENGMIINPLTNGLDQPDRLAAIVEEVALTPLGKDSWVNGNQLPQNFPVFRDRKGEYHFADTINVFGKIGLSIKTHDKREGANNKYQPHQIEIFVNDEIYHSLKFEKLSYNWQSTANYINDYRNSRLNLGDFVKLYRNYGDPTVPVHSVETDGTMELNKGYHKIKLVVYDAKENARVVHGTLFVMNPFEVNVTKQSETPELTSFLLQPISLAIPIKSAVIYSFTPYGFADRNISIVSNENIESGLVVTIQKKQMTNKTLQFIAQNDLGTISTPAHWANPSISGDHLSISYDLDISQTDAGVYIQIQPEKFIDEKISLRLKGVLKYISIPVNQIQPNVYLSSPLDPKEFSDVDQIETIISGNIERQILFKFPFTVVPSDSSKTIVSEDGYCSIKSRKDSYTDDILSWIEPVHKHPPIKGGMLHSRVYQLQPFERPLLEPMGIAMRYTKKLDNKKKHLYFYDKKEGWTFVKTKNISERRVLLGEVKHLDAVAIIEDNTPPIFIRSYPGNGGKFSSLELNNFRISIDDELSGFDPKPSSFDVSLNGERLYYAFQPKLKILSYDLEKPLAIGKHSIAIRASDQAGNELRKTIKFEVY